MGGSDSFMIALICGTLLANFLVVPLIDAFVPLEKLEDSEFTCSLGNSHIHVRNANECEAICDFAEAESYFSSMSGCYYEENLKEMKQ